MTDPTWRLRGSPLVAGAPDGPLAGCRVAVKDVFAVRGYGCGAGNPTRLAESRPAVAHAAAVAALTDAGAEITGIAHTDEFAYSLAGTNAHYGTPPNPAAPGRISGGSSSGPAAAVACGDADVGLGTDTAGSVRVPASYQGLHGLRTTHGAVSRDGMAPLAPTFDTVGWLTRDAELLARVTAVVLPAARRTPLTRTVVVPALLAAAEPGVRAAFGDLVGTPETVTIDAATLAGWAAAFRTVQGHEAWAAHGAWIDAHPGALGPDVAARFATAAQVDDRAASAARCVLERARAELRAILAPGTAMLLPTTSAPAPWPDPAAVERSRAATLGLTCLAGIAGVPAVSVPLLVVDGAPVGVSALAAPGTEGDLVDLARTMTA